MFRFWISQRLISLGFSSASSHHQGRLVRIAPDEISIADKDAIQVVLGHGTGNTKSEFCEYSIKADDLIWFKTLTTDELLNLINPPPGSVSQNNKMTPLSLSIEVYLSVSSLSLSMSEPFVHFSIFHHALWIGWIWSFKNTRDRNDHTRKRKMVSHTFSQKNVLEFEPFITSTIASFLNQWDRLSRTTTQEKEWYTFDCLPWFNFLAFDIIGNEPILSLPFQSLTWNRPAMKKNIINWWGPFFWRKQKQSKTGDLAFGEPFGMVERGEDYAEVDVGSEEKVLKLSAVKILNERGEYSMTQGCLKPWMRPLTPFLDPWFSRGAASVSNLAGVSVLWKASFSFSFFFHSWGLREKPFLDC